MSEHALEKSPVLPTGRPAGYEVMRVCLREQGDARPPLLGRILGVNPLATDARPWFAGATGEILVGSLLARLGPEWTVLHSLPIGSKTTDVDHLLVGPGGVIALNTKHHRDKAISARGRSFRVGGFQHNHVHASLGEAKRVAAALAAAGAPTAVSSAIVVVGATRLSLGATDVPVLDSSGLLRLLRRRKAVLEPERAAEIARVAGLASTWRATEPEADDPATVRAAFEALARRVRAARIRSAGWTVAASGALVVGCITLPPLILQAIA